MNKQRGFTLLELLVVIVILGVLISYVAPNYFGQLGQSKAGAARAQIHAFENALDRYRIDIGAYPETEQGLNALVKKPPSINRWRGPYLRKSLPKDPWGNNYRYEKISADSIRIVSLGGDGAIGGENTNADIDNLQ